MEIWWFILAGVVLVYLAAKFFARPAAPGKTFLPAYPTEENFHSEPIISYSLLVADIKTQRLIEVRAPEDYPHHYGILHGQHIELHWNVLNADFISIDGVGYVNAVGKKSFFPDRHTCYKITAKNRKFHAEQEIVVHVFPVPVMEAVFTPLPDLSAKIELPMQPVPVVPKPTALSYPDYALTSITAIRDKTIVRKPDAIALQRDLLRTSDPLAYRSFKTRLFDLMEKRVAGNYKLTDIIRTIRKHYE